MTLTVTPKDVHELAGLGRIVKAFPIHRLSLHYDAEADVLYVKFAAVAPSYQSELTDEHFLIEYDATGTVVGVTILDASQR